MTTRKFGRTALIAVLALSIIMSITGGTIAWFTDEVTSTGNKIEAGTLDISLLMHNGATYEDISDSKDPIFGADSIAQNNNAETLWEPGKTQVAYLAIKNNGNLAVKYQVSLNVENVSKDLYKVMEYAIVPDAEPNDVTGWTSGKTTVVGKQTASDVVSLSVGATHYFALAIHMAEEAGNEYQGGAVNFDMTVLATQDTVENDAFDNQYDAGATTIPSYWNGKVPTEMPDTLVVDGDTQTVHVKDADAFAYLSTLSEKWADLYTDGNGRTYTNYANGKGANYYYSGSWTISLDTDIDLKNYPIAPVVINVGQNTGYTAFNGNHHVIRNINTTTGLFEDSTRASYSNLVLENVKATNGALTGFSRSAIANVIVKNATISGGDYVGGLVGKAYSNVNNCKVIDSTVIATGKEAGGLIGYAETTSTGSSIANNTVKNVSVYANNRAAGLVAQPNVNIKVYNNTVDTVTVGAEDTSTYQPGAIVSNALASANIYDNTVINTTTLENVDFVKNADDLVALGGTKIKGNYVLTADIDMAGKNMKSMELSGGAVVKFYGNGHTISNLNLGAAKIHGMTGTGNEVAGLFDLSAPATTVSLTVSDLTVKNATVSCSGYAAAIVGYNSDSDTVITLNNVDVDGAEITSDTVAALVAYTTSKVNLNDCDVKGLTLTGEAGRPDKVGAYIGTANTAGCVVTVTNCTNGTTYNNCGRVINGATYN